MPGDIFRLERRFKPARAARIKLPAKADRTRRIKTPECIHKDSSIRIQPFAHTV